MHLNKYLIRNGFDPPLEGRLRPVAFAASSDAGQGAVSVENPTGIGLAAVGRATAAGGEGEAA